MFDPRAHAPRIWGALGLLFALPSCVVLSSDIRVHGQVVLTDGSPAAGRAHNFCLIAHFAIGDMRDCAPVVTDAHGEFDVKMLGHQRDIDLGDFQYAEGHLESSSILTQPTMRSLLKIDNLRYENDTHHLWGTAEVRFR